MLDLFYVIQHGLIHRTITKTLNTTIFFLDSTLFSRHFYPEIRDLNHPEHGRQPPNSCPITNKPHQHHHECLRYQRRCRRRRRFSSHSCQDHRRSQPQVDRWWHRRNKSPPDGRLGARDATWNNTNYTTINRNGGGGVAIVVATAEGRGTQQPTKSMETGIEQMWLAGEEGEIYCNTTITWSGDDAIFCCVYLCV